MSQEAVAKLMEHWLNEPGFRQRLRADPEGTVKRSGLQLSDDEWAALRRIDWSQTDEELHARGAVLFR